MDRPTPNPPPITILMAVRDGAAFLPEQLDSFAAQTHEAWDLIVSDDGSRDDSRAVIQHFAARHPAGRVRLIEGPRRGATANFLHLLGAAAPGRMLAFSDQDDVWHRDKLARAAAALSDRQGPAHYSARTMICDQDLTPLSVSPRFRRPFGLRNALIQACTAGNTSVFNAEAATLLRAGAAAADAAGIVAHDWWAYQLLSAAGAAILKDDRPVLQYRQHGRNAMGRNDTARERLRRLTMLFDGQFGAWLSANHRALMGAANLLRPDNLSVIEEFGAALSMPGPRAARRFAGLGLYRHDRAGTAAFYAAAATGRLRRS